MLLRKQLDTIIGFPMSWIIRWQTNQVRRSSVQLYVYLVVCFLEKASSQTSTSSYCESCLNACEDSWWEHQLSTAVCSSCISGCGQQELAFFFHRHACIEVDPQAIAGSIPPHYGSISNSYCEGLNDVVVRTVRASLLQQFDQCLVQLNLAREEIERNRFEQAIIAQHSGRFADESEIAAMNQTVALPVVRSGLVSRELCPSRTHIDWPLTATHVSGVIVDVLQKKKKKQIFHMRSCKFNSPIPPVEGAVCKVGKNKHKALIRITWEHIRENQSSQRFRNCRPASTNFFVCDDWIELDAYCAVHIM